MSKKNMCGNQESISIVIHNYIQHCLVDGLSGSGLYQSVMNEAESCLLHSIMKKTDGNQTKAATILGIPRSTLRRKLAEHQSWFLKKI